MNSKKGTFEEWSNIQRGMEEYILSSREADIRRDDREEGIDTQKEALSLRASMLGAVKQFRRQSLTSAREVLSKEGPQSFSLSNSVRTSSPQNRRALLRAAFERSPTLTAQFRQLDELTDEDVLSALEDLASLEQYLKLDKEDGRGGT